MCNVKENYHYILDEIASTAERCGRNPAEILLLAVTKGIDWLEALQAYQAGCRNFGESRVQEAIEKMPPGYNDIRWHLIGTLQKNKVKKVVGHFSLIHSIDSFELLKKVSDSSMEASLVTHVLLQVNTSGELSKHGLSEEGWERVYEQALILPGISIEGLMTIAPLTEDERVIARCFARLRTCKEKLIGMEGKSSKLHHLSMGMSHDFRIAIAEGATILRIGTAIFE